MAEATSAAAYLEDLLRRYGLESLVDWAKNELATGAEDVVVLQHLRERPEFQVRFKVIFDRQAAGLPPVSPAEVIEYEKAATQLMSAYGLPKGYYDTPEDFQALLFKDVSPLELQTRLQSGYTRVLMAPPEVRQAFTDFFGPEGDGALASFFLDPDKAQPILEQNLAMAIASGTGTRYGLAVDYGMAESLARKGVSEQDLDMGMKSLVNQSPIFEENYAETEDLSINREGLAATFSLDPASSGKITKRIGERQAKAAGTGGPAMTQRGVIGTGKAE